VGKTSILEALSLLTQLKSFRSAKSSELIQNGYSQSSVSAELEKPTVSRVLLALEGNQRRVQIDEKSVLSRAKYPFIGGSVTFSPDDLLLIKGGPEGRRDFLNELCIALNPAFGLVWKKYEKILKQRNLLLKMLKERKAHLDSLVPWTQGLIEAAVPIYQERAQTVKILRETMGEIYRSLFGVQETISTRYEHRLELIPDCFDTQEIERLLVEKLNRYAEAEIASGYSLVGPHKDDLSLSINDLEARSFASQGQIRGLVIALKVAQLELTKKFRTFTPILLLDDIISELDDSRVQALVSYLSDYPGQLFVTTAEVSKVRSLHSQFQGFKVINLGEKSPESPHLEACP